MRSVIQVSEVHYPESDGKPMGETDEHRDAMIRHIQILQDYYRGQRVYVSGNILVYYEQGNTHKSVVPDAFVVKGISSKRRRVYKIWIERKGPDVVIETTARKTRRKDMVDKPQLYARLGVKEYFLFDPDQEYLDPPLQGYRLSGVDYVPIGPGPSGSLTSEELGLRLCVEEGWLEFYRLDTGERLLAPEERAEAESQRAEAESQRADREAQARQREAEARQAAESELARLRAELSRRPSA